MPPALRPRTRASHVDAPRVTTWLPGPPLRLPSVLDRVAEGWWRLTPRARTAIVVLAALATVVVVLLRVALSPYGPPVDVLVTTRDLATGSELGPGDVSMRRWPRDLVPPDPLLDPAALAGARLTARVTAGTVLDAGHLREDGPLARLGVDRAAVVIDAQLLQGVGVDTRLDLVGVAGDGSGRVLARDSRVLAVEDGMVWVEVPRDRAADVAAAALRGTLSGAVLAP